MADSFGNHRVDSPGADHLSKPSFPTPAPARDRSDLPISANIPDQLLHLTVTHPATGVCVVTVDGELDMLTTPLLDNRIRDQLAAVPKHLILDLEPVRFLGSNGLTCLLEARELTQQITGTRLLLAGLANRLVARPLQLTDLLDLFETYPTLTDALESI